MATGSYRTTPGVRSFHGAMTSWTVCLYRWWQTPLSVWTRREIRRLAADARQGAGQCLTSSWTALCVAQGVVPDRNISLRDILGTVTSPEEAMAKVATLKLPATRPPAQIDSPLRISSWSGTAMLDLQSRPTQSKLRIIRAELSRGIVCLQETRWGNLEPQVMQLQLPNARVFATAAVRKLRQF